MTRSHQRLSVFTAWALLPMAVWSGVPSTACLCANGRVKIFCQHLLANKLADHRAACGRSCCCDEVEDQHDDSEVDCCRASGQGRNKPDGTGVTSTACCRPILSGPSAAPEISVVPPPAVLTSLPDAGMSVEGAFVPTDVAELNTGPPLDRVIAFRSLLI